MKIKKPVIIHIIVWAIIFSLPYVFNMHNEHEGPNAGLVRFFISITTIFWMALFYLNANVLIPKLLYRKKYIFYLALLVLLYGIILLIFAALFKILLPDNLPFDLYASAGWNLIPYLFIIMISATYKTIYDKIKADTIAGEKQKENLKTELSFLRSQISPHFLFNVLNNILSLIRLKSDEAEPTVLKLSSLMQYMLYDTDEEKVSLAEEASYLKSYIDLQKQRFGNKVKVNAKIDTDDSAHAIEPMLLIPFVENAFKHGVGMIDKPEINIQLYTKENMLYFFMQNKYNETNIVKDKTSGIGLANVTRRLQLLHGKEHKLTIKKDDNIYSVSLQIKLK